jgi:hypothetical protein
LYVPAAIDCCKAATLSVRTSLPDNACAINTAFALKLARSNALALLKISCAAAGSGAALFTVFAALPVLANAAASVALNACCGLPIPFK